MTDAYGNDIIKKLGDIYKDKNQKLDNRLRIGEALLQTVQRCGDALGKYGNTNATFITRCSLTLYSRYTL